MIKVELLKSIAPKQEVSRAKGEKSQPVISFSEILKNTQKQNKKSSVNNSQETKDNKDSNANVTKTGKTEIKEKKNDKETKGIKVDHLDKKIKQKEEKKISHKGQIENKAVALADTKLVVPKETKEANEKKSDENKIGMHNNKIKTESKFNKTKTVLKFGAKEIVINGENLKNTKNPYKKANLSDKKEQTKGEKIEVEKGKKIEVKKENITKGTTAKTSGKVETKYDLTDKKVTVTKETEEKLEKKVKTEKNGIEDKKDNKTKEVKINKTKTIKNAESNYKIGEKETGAEKKKEPIRRVLTKETKVDQNRIKKTEEQKNTTYNIKTTKTQLKHSTQKVSETTKNKELHSQKFVVFDNKKVTKVEIAQLKNKKTQNIKNKPGQKEVKIEIKQTNDEIKQSITEEKEVKTAILNQKEQKVKHNTKKKGSEKEKNSEQTVTVAKVSDESKEIKSRQANQGLNYKREQPKGNETKEKDNTKWNNEINKSTQYAEYKTTPNRTKKIHNSIPNISAHTLANNTTHTQHTQLNPNNLHPPLDKVIEEIDKIVSLKPPVTRSLTIKLNPPHLGNLHLKVSLNIQKNLTVSIATHDKDTYKTIVNHLDSLKEYLATNGIKVQNIDVHNSFNENFMNQFSNGSGSFQQQSQANGNQAQNSGFGYMFRKENQLKEAGGIRKITTSGIDVTA